MASLCEHILSLKGLEGERYVTSPCELILPLRNGRPLP